MKALFICNTPFQVLTSLIIKSFFSELQEADIVVSDLINGYENIVENLMNENFFNNTFTFHVKDCYSNRKKERVKYFVKQIYCELNYCRMDEIEKIMDNTYDQIFVTNTHCFINTIVCKQYKKNKYLKVLLVDEGYYTYTNMIEGDLFGFAQGRNAVRGIGDCIHNRPHLNAIISKTVLMNSDLLCWKMPYENIRLPVVNIREQVEFKKLINRVFGYDEIRDNYDRKYIFFEESFHMDQGKADDIQLLDIISSVVGKENVIVKLHPRSQINRFSGLGYATNSKHEVPWEVIAANLNDQNTINLITISSGAAINSSIIFNKNFKTIFLYKCSEQNFVKWDSTVADFFEKYTKIYSEKVYVPNNVDELRFQIDEKKYKGK